MTNININTFAGMTLEEIADAILANGTQFSDELKAAANDFIEDKRIDKEYLEDVEAVAEHEEKRAAAKAISDTQILKEAKVGDQIIVDTAYTCPPMGEHADDDDEIIVKANALVDDDDEVVVNKGFRGDPEDGLHTVVLVDYPEKQEGRNGNGDYRVLRFRDKELFNEWTMIVSEEDLGKRLQEISYNNKGCLAEMTKKRCFAYLMVNGFSAWTVKNNKGRVVTYFDEYNFNKYFRWVQQQKQEKEDAYAQRHSKQISKEELKAPWEY